MAVTRVSIFKFEALVYQSLDRFLVSVADPGSGIQCFFVAWIPRIRIRELGWKKIRIRFSGFRDLNNNFFAIKYLTDPDPGSYAFLTLNPRSLLVT